MSDLESGKLSLELRLDVSQKAEKQFLMDLAGAEKIMIGEIEYSVGGTSIGAPGKISIHLARLGKKREKIGVVLDTEKISDNEYRAKVRLE
jgi:hypothetical protein